MSPDRGRPAYAETLTVPGRVTARLISMHRDEWLVLLREDQTDEQTSLFRGPAATRLISMHWHEWLVLLREDQTAEPYVEELA